MFFKSVIYSILLLISTSTLAENVYQMPLYRVIDGDTVVVKASWLPPELGTTISIRILGVDTPEKNYLAKCQAEKELGLSASAFTKSFFADDKTVYVTFKKWDKYGGRIIGNVSNSKNEDLSAALINAGLARPYFGGAKSSWCK